MTMTQQQIELWSKILNNTEPGGLLCRAVRHAAQSLSEMVNQPLQIKNLKIVAVPLNELVDTIYDNDFWDHSSSINYETETVGIYLLVGDDLPGQAMLTLSVNDALYMVDWLLEERPGTTTKLDSLGCSALSEMGNLVLSSFLNAIAEFTHDPLRPSPPAMMVDMLATVLQTAVTLIEVVTDELIVIKVDFINVENSLLIHFWLLPDPSIVGSPQKLGIGKSFSTNC